MARINIMRYLAVIALTLAFVLPVQARMAVPMPQPDPCANHAPYTPIAERNEKTLLYKITAPCHQPAMPTSYLFGTFHSDSPKLKPLYDKVLKTFDVVDAVALEIVQTPNVQRVAQRALTLPNDHKGLKSLLSDATWKKTVRLIGPLLQVTEGQLNSFKPWALAVLSQYPAPESDGVVLDQRIQRRAEAGQLDVISLESIDDQFTVFESLSEKNQIAFLELTLQDLKEMPAMHTRLTRLYLAEDTRGIMTMSDELFDEMATKNPTLAYHLRVKLIDERNVRMTKHMGTQMDKTPTLFAIGALHLPGDMGMISLLEEKGYRIYPVE